MVSREVEVLRVTSEFIQVTDMADRLRFKHCSGPNYIRDVNGAYTEDLEEILYQDLRIQKLCVVDSAFRDPVIKYLAIEPEVVDCLRVLYDSEKEEFAKKYKLLQRLKFLFTGRL